jgi:hypothetical protein
MALLIVAAALHGGPALAAEETAGDIPVTRDLTAVIALQGLPCGQVVSARQQAENDYKVLCQDGTGYRVFVNADGRVVVEKQQPQ